MKRIASSTAKTTAAIAAFLERHYTATHSGDVGPILGQLQLLRDEAPADAGTRRAWNTAVSRAVSGGAPRRVGRPRATHS
jgi:hypothetical protein